MCQSAEEKRSLREQFKERRKTLVSQEKDGEIAQRFLSSELFTQYHSFFVYLSIGSEVHTREIIERLLAAGKRVCVPRVVGREMTCVPYTETLEKGAFGIMQPKGGEECECEVALVPLLAVDRQGVRLGYGGGYYDRYFAKHPNVLRVGLAYGGQVTNRLPREETDCSLHALITEDGICYFS
ncbi:MAG: 5-formyltetrahydrofolate cyclo-ligase [Clostridiales bacterium]|nr:5-formyltetrahydrofolate cyclo-ligase [Clostridiales bacterium]